MRLFNSVDSVFDATKDLFYRTHALDSHMFAFGDIEIYQRSSLIVIYFESCFYSFDVIIRTT